ncbi:MAG: glycosyltransferase [Flavobacteriaceae bacterium]|nr:glycosyltransferase [Flavobacteriaceae bacterium]
MIPKIIHYCWFGDKKFNKRQKKCIRTWNEHLFDYEFMLWNEENIDMNHPFITLAYKHKKWAYISDYVRLQKLYEYGGIYLDTDMYVLKSFNKLLSDCCFFGAQDDKLIAAGIIGSTQGNIFIKNCLNHYNDPNPKEWKLRFANPRVITRVFVENGDYLPEFNDSLQINNVKIYSPKYFYPMPFVIDKPFDENFLKFAENETYAIHLWDGSWIEYSEFQLIRKRKYIQALTNIKYGNLHKTYYFKKLISSFLKSLKAT